MVQGFVQYEHGQLLFLETQHTDMVYGGLY